MYVGPMKFLDDCPNINIIMILIANRSRICHWKAVNVDDSGKAWDTLLQEWTKLVWTPAPGTLFVIHSLRMSTSRRT